MLSQCRNACGEKLRSTDVVVSRQFEQVPPGQLEAAVEVPSGPTVDLATEVTHAPVGRGVGPTDLLRSVRGGIVHHEGLHAGTPQPACVSPNRLKALGEQVVSVPAYYDDRKVNYFFHFELTVCFIVTSLVIGFGIELSGINDKLAWVEFIEAVIPSFMALWGTVTICVKLGLYKRENEVSTRGSN